MFLKHRIQTLLNDGRNHNDPKVAKFLGI